MFVKKSMLLVSDVLLFYRYFFCASYCFITNGMFVATTYVLKTMGLYKPKFDSGTRVPLNIIEKHKSLVLTEYQKIEFYLAQ